MNPRLVAAVLLALTAPVLADGTAAALYSQRHGETALLIWEGGRMVVERGSRSSANTFSITKSLAALGTLNAVGRGVLRLNEPVSTTLTTWQRDPRKQRITARQLLNQTSGLASGFETLYAKGVRDKTALVLKLPAVAAPGEVFTYGPSHYEALETLLAKKDSRPPASWLSLPFTGVRPENVRRDRAGQPYFSAGARLTPRQLLALGHLVRRRGWVGIFPVIPSSLMKEALAGSTANAIFGFGLWLNLQARQPGASERDIELAIAAGLTRSAWERTCLSRQAPPDLVAMVGSHGQRVYIIPSRNQVIVRLGNADSFRDPDFLRALYR